jgi:hypothetical protein
LIRSSLWALGAHQGIELFLFFVGQIRQWRSHRAGIVADQLRTRLDDTDRVALAAIADLQIRQEVERIQQVGLGGMVVCGDCVVEEADVDGGAEDVRIFVSRQRDELAGSTSGKKCACAVRCKPFRRARRSRGKRLGRPNATPRRVNKGLSQIRQGMTYQEAAERSGVSISTLPRARRKGKAA